MKNKVLIFCFAILLYGCDDSSNNDKKGKKIHYLFIIDNPDKEVVAEFASCFNNGTFPLRTEQPEGIANISFTVYIPMPLFTKINIDFSENDDKGERVDKAADFLSRLKKYEGKAEGDRYILKAINALLSQVKDTAADYRILFISNMIENSGAASSSQKDGWENGEFCFADPMNNCNPEVLNEATKQLSDSTRWIYKNLVARSGKNLLLRQQHILYDDQGFEVRKINGGCDGTDIQTFWESLFRKMGISYEIQSNSLKDFLTFQP